MLTSRCAGVVLAVLLVSLPAAQPASAASSPAGPQVHVVKAGETVWSISRMHGLVTEVIVRVNTLSSPDRLQIGQRLTIPAPSSPGVSTGPPLMPRRAVGMAWPSRGIVTSRFGFRGRRHHHGIDISALIGTPITAALGGTVQFAGWLGGYGKLVILDHGGGLTTYYGHASRLLVKVGDRVTQGQLIAQVGTTGNVTGPNVHFEVRRNKVPLDPLAFLQGQR